MSPKYLLKDNLGNVGKSVSIVQGESRDVTLFLFNDDGTPLVYTPTPTEILVKIYSTINQASIQYKQSLAKVVAVASTQLGGIIGLKFTLAAADSQGMAPNNSGLPMSAIFTDGSGNVLELDFQSAFNVSAPLIQT